MEAPKIDQSRQTILNRELSVMRKRMVMVKYSLFFAGISFILNLCALFSSYYGHQEIAPNFMGGTIIVLMISMTCFCWETTMSTKALDLHISKLKWIFEKSLGYTKKYKQINSCFQFVVQWEQQKQQTVFCRSLKHSLAANNKLLHYCFSTVVLIACKTTNNVCVTPSTNLI